MGVDDVVIRELHTAAGQLTQFQQPKKVKRYPCLYPWERLVVSAKGKIKFCPGDWMGGSEIGDLNTSTIAEIWEGEYMSRLRGAHLHNNFGDHSFCGKCPDWENTCWPEQGRSYSDMVGELCESA